MITKAAMNNIGSEVQITLQNAFLNLIHGFSLTPIL